MCSITFSLPEAWYFCNVVKPPHDCRRILHSGHAYCGEEQQAVCQSRSRVGPRWWTWFLLPACATNSTRRKHSTGRRSCGQTYLVVFVAPVIVGIEILHRRQGKMSTERARPGRTHTHLHAEGRTQLQHCRGRDDGEWRRGHEARSRRGPACRRPHLHIEKKQSEGGTHKIKSHFYMRC